MKTRSILALPALLLAGLLAACSNEAPAPATAPATEAAPVAESAPAAPETAPAAATEAAPQETPAEAAPATPVEPAAAVASAPILPPTGPEPREGVDYTVIDPPAPFAAAPGKIEVAEAFAYYCIHCAHLQEKIGPWKAKLPADVEFRYVPMAEGQAEPLARAFYASEAMGELDKVHDKLFDLAAVQRRIKTGAADEVASLYAELGVDKDALQSTMQSFAINAQIARNQKAVRSWAIEGTPTMIVNGRYKAVVTQDRGHDGMLSAVEHLVARERARLAGTPALP